ncbi:MAG: flagellar biosynthesis anti-sigma factor FlgM [Oscillospiraceae bacterium]|jgi:anti-sigma28 factor (negative regulator of flagellin synthesis)|nr:flagellar biosynthesis anti-sigma factor FlgM [Oscillospiraceae bacterium]
MKINSVTANTAIPAFRAGKLKRPAAAELLAAPDETGFSNVNFSNEALAFSKILSDAKEKLSAPAVSGRVPELREAIERGEYGVSAYDVAESIVSALR